MLMLCAIGASLFASQERSERRKLGAEVDTLQARLVHAEWVINQLSGRVGTLERAPRGALPAEVRAADVVDETPQMEAAAPSASPDVAHAETLPAPSPEAVHVAVPLAPPPPNVALSPSVPYPAGAQAPMPPSAPQPSKADTTPGLDLEQWLGLRGAAVAGALVLVAAGAAFFQYSVERGLIGPGVRVAIGALLGVALMGGGELPIARRYERLARLLQGAGASIAYFAAWSASARYGIAPTWLSMLAMVVITAVTCLIAGRHHSLATATLGLAGGFATPLLLATGEDRPIALFAYLGVLDFGLLHLSRKRQWGGLALFALVVTLLYEAAWVATRMRPDRMPLGMLIVVGLSALFVAFAETSQTSDDATPSQRPQAFGVARLIAALSPFVFAMHTSVAGVVVEHALMTSAFLVVLHGATILFARREGSPFVAVLGAGATAAVTLVAISHAVSVNETTLPFFAALGFAGLVHVFAADEGDGADLLAVALFLAACIRGVVPHREAFPIVLVVTAIGIVVLAKNAAARTRPSTAYLLGIGSAFTIGATVYAQRHVPDAIPENALPLASVALTFALAALSMRAPASLETHPRHAASFGIAVLLLSLAPWAASDCVTAVGVSLTCIVIAAVGLVVAIELPVWPVVVMLVLAIPMAASSAHPQERVLFDVLRAALLFTSGSLGALLPRITTRVMAQPSARIASAIAPLVFLAPLFVIYDGHYGTRALLLVPFAIALAPLLGSRPLSDAPLDAHFVVAALLIAIGIVIELDDNAVVAALTALGAFSAWIWQRARRTTFLVVTFVAVAVAMLRALVCWALPEYGLMYPFISPITLGFVGAPILLFLIAHLVESPAPGHDTPTEDDATRARIASLATGARICALVLVFAFLSLVFRDAFGLERSIPMPFDRGLLIAVSTSLGYAVYALTLVGVGIRKDHAKLRSIGLALFALTSVKIFLVDLGRLRDLYRVASLLGLAVTLLLVSVAYHRFVLRARPPTALPPTGG